MEVCEDVHHSMKIQESALSHSHLKLETEHSNSQATIRKYIIKLTEMKTRQ
jgi:hypothetical protein